MERVKPVFKIHYAPAPSVAGYAFMIVSGLVYIPVIVTVIIQGVDDCFILYPVLSLIFNLLFFGGHWGDIYLHTCIYNDELVSKLYWFEKRRLKWEEIKYVAVYCDLGDRRIWGHYKSPCIVVSNEEIKPNHCRMFGVKSSRNIKIRVTGKNADAVIPFVNEKLGLSFEYEKLLKIEFGKPLMLELPERE